MLAGVNTLAGDRTGDVDRLHVPSRGAYHFTMTRQGSPCAYPSLHSGLRNQEIVKLNLNSATRPVVN